MCVEATPLICGVGHWAIARCLAINSVRVVNTEIVVNMQIPEIGYTPLIGDGGRRTEVHHRGVCCVGVINAEIVCEAVQV